MPLLVLHRLLAGDYQSINHQKYPVMQKLLLLIVMALGVS